MAERETPLTLDLFCRIVDNYGDIGVCWRLARQLAAEVPCSPRLIVDDLLVFKKIEPRLDENAARQSLAGVTILHWAEAALLQHYGEPGDAVIEAFACELPAPVVTKMTAKTTPPVWIDLEYLSAEGWVETCHAIPSLHPATGLQKTLFFPGFTAKTGGLFREETLLVERSKFAADTALQNQWRAQHGVPQKTAGTLDISLFCYKDAPLEFLLADMALSPDPVRLLVPHGIAEDKLAGVPAQQGNLTILPIPFLEQWEYDRLLWTCDLNFVRGEDSWLRAIWAAKPFIWLAYPQERGASHVKLEAFLGRYMQGLEPSLAESLADFHAMWNLGVREGKSGPRSWHDLLPHLPELEAHARAWTETQARQDDCATQVIRFIRAQMVQPTLKVTG